MNELALHVIELSKNIIVRPTLCLLSPNPSDKCLLGFFRVSPAASENYINLCARISVEVHKIDDNGSQRGKDEIRRLGMIGCEYK